MDLGSFLADETLGGGDWADEEVDMTSIGVPTSSTSASNREFRGNDYQSYQADENRRERTEYPVPDKPPYRARIGNLPWELVEEDVVRFFEGRMQMYDIIEEVKLPMDTATGRLKGYGFVTFKEKEALEEALSLTSSDFNGRRLFVNVAAPQRADVFDSDWRANRTGPLAPRRGEDGPELDWGAARNERVSLPPREYGGFRGDRGDRGERSDRPRRDEPELDWGAARGTQVQLPPRDRPMRRPRRDEAELDWGSARNEQGALPPRERLYRRPKKDEPELDWGSARSATVELPPRERSIRRRKEPELDWNTARTGENKLPPRERSNRKPAKSEDAKPEQQGPQKSAFDVLAVEGDSDDESKPQAKTEEAVEKLAESTANLNVTDDQEGWETVGK